MVKKSNKKVIAVVVTYNRKELLKECIDALKKQNYRDCKILIIDNASTDGTYDSIKSLIDGKKIYYKNTHKNLGGAGGFNFGIKEASKIGCDYVWLMDDDSIVHKNSLEKLLEYDEKLKGEYGFLASKVIWKDNSICKMNIPRKSLFKSNNDFESDMVNIITSSFVSFFTKMSTVREVGLPISEFFIWTDDWEYSRRISRKYPSYLINKSIVTHKCNSNFGCNIVYEKDDRLSRYNYAFRNEGYYYRREGIVGILYVFLRQFYYLLSIIFSSCDKKIKRLCIVFKNTFKGFFFYPKVEYLDKEN